jgi:hypothetical protein
LERVEVKETLEEESDDLTQEEEEEDHVQADQVQSQGSYEDSSSVSTSSSSSAVFSAVSAEFSAAVDPEEPWLMQSGKDCVSSNSENMKEWPAAEGKWPKASSSITSYATNNLFLAEHFSLSLTRESARREMSHALKLSNGHALSNEDKDDQSLLPSSMLVMRQKLLELDVETERMSARASHLRAKNQLLEASLNEAKDSAEHMSTVIAHHESNTTALNLASAQADQLLEAADTLMALKAAEANVDSAKRWNDQERVRQMKYYIHKIIFIYNIL